MELQSHEHTSCLTANQYPSSYPFIPSHIAFCNNISHCSLTHLIPPTSRSGAGGREKDLEEQSAALGGAPAQQYHSLEPQSLSQNGYREITSQEKHKTCTSKRPAQNSHHPIFREISHQGNSSAIQYKEQMRIHINRPAHSASV